MTGPLPGAGAGSATPSSRSDTGGMSMGWVVDAAASELGTGTAGWNEEGQDKGSGCCEVGAGG